MESRYEARGVSSSKEEVHKAIEKLDKGLFPGAFCKILPDVFTDSVWHCILSHSDGAGTKTALAYLAWRETEDLRWWDGIPQDSLVMNFDDMGCVGALGPFAVTQAINRNKARIPGEVLQRLIEKTEEFLELLRGNGIDCYYAGGETADVGDLVRTLTIDNTITTRMSRGEVIDASDITPGSIIVGFSSTGQAAWESRPNSGIGANGLTNARHDTLSARYIKYEETYAPETDPSLVYCGGYTLEDVLPGNSEFPFTIAEALLSPTRTYLPLIKDLERVLGRNRFQALIHCSGGGQTKIGKFGPRGVRYRKHSPFPVPPLFEMLQQVRKVPWREMYSTYNMGHRFEAIVGDQTVADACIQISKSLGIEARVIGWVEDDPSNPNGRTVEIATPAGVETYSFS